MIYDEDPFRRSRRNRQQVKTTGGVCLNGGKPVQMGLPTQENREIRSSGGGGNYSVPSTVARLYDFREPGGYLGNVGLTRSREHTYQMENGSDGSERAA